jgi:RsiW-degrading membrane proteinase PrsW (M82 family)
MSVDMTTVWRRPWLQILVAGAILYFAMERVLVSTGNINLVPGVICLGAFLGPVAFVAYVYERAPEVPLHTLMWCFLAGGVLGVSAAGLIEYQTLVTYRALPTAAIGLAEETSKLIMPFCFFLLWRYRREADGLLFGVASAMGFAAFESMGYGLTVLIASGGRIDALERVLLVRNLLSPAGHAAWTGLVCAALWRARIDPSPLAKLGFLATFAAAVGLHALWDSSTSRWELALVALVSWGLLTWRLANADRERRRLAMPTAGERPGLARGGLTAPTAAMTPGRRSFPPTR